MFICLYSIYILLVKIHFPSTDHCVNMRVAVCTFDYTRSATRVCPPCAYITSNNDNIYQLYPLLMHTVLY